MRQGYIVSTTYPQKKSSTDMLLFARLCCLYSNIFHGTVPVDTLRTNFHPS